MSESGDFGEAVYLGLDDVLELYAGIFQCTVEEATDQLRSRSGLEGALARPLWHAHYSGAGLACRLGDRATSRPPPNAATAKGS